jgi:hypothetical protein
VQILCRLVSRRRPALSRQCFTALHNPAGDVGADFLDLRGERESGNELPHSKAGRQIHFAEM